MRNPCTGYHGTDQDSASSILKEGFKSSDDYQWFGRGIYFFDDYWPHSTGEEEAKNWAIYERNKIKWAVVCATINTGTMFDIYDNVEHRKKFNEAAELLLKKHMAAGKEAIYFKDRMVFREIEKANVYGAIRALVDSKKKYYISIVVWRPQLQICVKDDKLIEELSIHSSGEAI